MSNHTAPNAAKQLYMEQFGEAIVTNSYLKIAVAVLSLVIWVLCSWMSGLLTHSTISSRW